MEISTDDTPQPLPDDEHLQQSQSSQFPPVNSSKKFLYCCSISPRVCCKVFSKRSDLSAHVKKVHKLQVINSNEPISDDGDLQQSQHSQLPVANPSKKYVYICSICSKTFSTASNLSAHIKRVHKQRFKLTTRVVNLDKLSPDDVHLQQLQHLQLPLADSSKKIVHLCNICSKVFSSRTNLNRHTQEVHKQRFSLSKAKPKVCPLCRVNLPSYKELDEHILSVHDICIEHNTLEFKNEDEFLRWKLENEKDTKSFYKLSCFNEKQGKKCKYYVCHRTGVYQTKMKAPERKRALKSKGSIKINSHCPARLTVQLHKDGPVIVDYVSQHVGHELDVAVLPLNPLESQDLAEKLSQGIPPQRILKDISDNCNPETRIGLTTKQDLINIKRAYKINNSEYKLHPDDATNVDILIKKYQHVPNSPILYYKPLGAEDPVMGKNNFVLIFMDSVQQDFLSKYGDDIFLISSTQGTNPYNIQLTTLMVMDDELEGFPVAFLWSIAQTEMIFQKFFLCLKQKVPDVKPNAFMSGDVDALFNAFLSVYNAPETQKLLCDRSVKKNIWTNLRRIKNADKQKEVKSCVMKLINELDVLSFHVLLEQILQVWCNDSDTLDFYLYFRDTYSNRPTQWANCYIRTTHVYDKIRNANVALESWHRDIKHNSTAEGKRQQTLDFAINNVLDGLRRTFFKRLIDMSPNEMTNRLSDLRIRHKVAEQLKDDLQIFEGSYRNKWQIASVKNFFEVTREEKVVECTCSLRCSECCSCLHEYSCSCPDYVITYNMCKHIHLVCMKLLEISCATSVPAQAETTEDSDNETDHNYSQKNTVKPSLDEQKLEALEKSKLLMKAIESSQSLEAVTHVIHHLTCAFNVLDKLTPKDPLQ